MIDLRSDTVTRPPAGMREAMARAEVGDDVLDGDPTTRALEERVAELLGKERALFFPSGIMANQAALAVLGRPGTLVAAEAGSHVIHYEEGAAAALSGLQIAPVESEGGLLEPDRLRKALPERSRFHPAVSVLVLENTHLASGGRTLDVARTEALAEAAREREVAIHLDGARLWNAAAALGCSPTELAAPADTVMVSMSKGIGAPVGSVLAGGTHVLEEVWRVRRRLGGSMRQSGILAAAALWGLDHQLPRIGRDHARARRLADGLADLEGLEVGVPETNIVMVDLVDPELSIEEMLNFLEGGQILVVKFAPRRLRAVTHLDLGDEAVERAVAGFRRAVSREGMG